MAQLEQTVRSEGDRTHHAGGMKPKHACVFAVLVMLGGSPACYREARRPVTLQTRTDADDRPAVTPPELFSLTETLADTYVVTITQVADQVQEGSPAQMREYAQQLKTFVATTAYVLAASPNPEVSIMDLTVNISVHHRFLADGLAERWFENRAQPLLAAYASVEDTAWKTLARVYTEEQLAVLRDGIERWWAENEHTTLQLVRLPDLAKYRDLSLVESPGSIHLLEPVAEATKTAMELRLLGERALFVAQRFPYIVKWHGEEAFYDTLATPEVRGVMEDMHRSASSVDRLADLMEQLPNSRVTRQTLAEFNTTLREAVALLGAARGVIGEGKETLRATDAFLQARDLGGGAASASFDVTQYTAALQEMGAAARELNAFVGNATRLVESPVLDERLEQTQRVADTGVGRLAELGNGWIDRVFWRGLGLIGAFFGGLFAYRVAATWVVRRLSL
jgi:hypothetical protein